MRKWFFIALVLAGCHKTDTGPETTYVLQGILREGEAVSGIRVHSLVEFEGEGMQENIGDAEVTISYNGNIVVLDYDAATESYVDTDEVIAVNPDTEYAIVVNVGGKTLESTAVVPPNVELVFNSEQVLPIDPETSSEPIFSIIWEAIEGHVFVLTLENQETDPVEIPFSNGGGEFDLFFQFPLDVTGVTIYDTDFTYYGTHRLSVYAISTEYEQVFYYSPASLRENLNNGPDNVQGGSGYFVGASSTWVTLEVE